MIWICPKCKRIFNKKAQPHSCRKMPLEMHFKDKETAKELFDYLVTQINSTIGKYRIISIPCCIHLYGKYDFMAALPKKDRLEIRFSLNRKLDNQRLKISVQMSQKIFKNCLDISLKKQIDKELMGWLYESYHLKDNQGQTLSKEKPTPSER